MVRRFALTCTTIILAAACYTGSPVTGKQYTSASPKPHNSAPANSVAPKGARVQGLQVTQSNYRGLALFQERIDIGNIDYTKLQAVIFHVTNTQRAQNGLPLLSHHPLLEKAAKLHAKRMTELDFYEHEDPYDTNLRKPSDRGRHVGITNAMLAENIHFFGGLSAGMGESIYELPGRGKYSFTPSGPAIEMHTYLSFADAIVEEWMNSPGHRANILEREVYQLGVGVEFLWDDDLPKFKAVQNFQQFSPVKP